MRTFVTVIMGVAIFCSLSACKKSSSYRDYENHLDEFNGSALQYLEAQTGQYDSFLLAINRVQGLKDSLAGKPITLFAVSNKSFDLALQNINTARADSLPVMPPVSIRTIDLPTLDTFLCRYILRGQYLSDDFLQSGDGLRLPSIKYDYDMVAQFISTNASGYIGGGPREIKFSDPKKSIFVRYWVSVNTITTDIKTTNGIVNVLPPGHDFGFGADFVRAVNKR
ncbi:fasciclin domain-containing protein [Niabella pedocola]|uniref:Fasciclin domain-containing protein n=1 Tax=Niabella pedocola TaxID=1752077 RepID=A0ABS8PUA3_9BACT|nr:fasciclin domain-containing protein [Niabella pedocola]MCD2424657.1 fasciclin domain-containing protein [Niabella pedocola]